jgi:glycosyltransferase involved in cell wall biosynthesis
LILVGTRQQTGKYQQQIEALIARKGLQNRVLFTDQVNNPAVLEGLFRHARLLFVTSEWESFCVPVAESLFFSVPTAVHHVPPLPEVAGPAGLVFDKADPQAAANQVLALLGDDARYRQMRQAATSWAAQYSDEALADNLKQFFARIT